LFHHRKVPVPALRGAAWIHLWPAFARVLIVLVFLAIYFLSGFSALLYQVIWHRMLAIFSGSDLYATTTIVAAFMAGLGTGSLIGGRLADALSFRWQIGLFALLELVIGLFALISTWWYYDILYVRHATLASSPVILAIVLFCSLLVPTCCMGMSFPLISKALTPSVAMAGRRIGSLYAMNTLGGAVGAFVTVWFWMGALDFPAILRIGAQVNFVVAALALLAGLATWLHHRQRARVADVDGEGPVRAGQPAPGFSSWMWLYALAGFLALSWEIVWFRLLGVILKSNSFTFPHLLAIYLGGLAVGILAGARLVHLGAHPGRVYLGLQLGVSLYAGLSLVVLFQALEHWSSAAWLQAYLAGFDPLDVSVVQYALNNWWSAPDELWSALAGQSGFLLLYIVVPFILVGPPTLLMGASFAFLQRAVQDDRACLGRRVGWLQAANILGATLGSIITGTVLLHLLGTAQTARVLLAIGGVFLLPLLPLSFGARAPRLAASGIAVVVALALMWSIPAGPRFWALLHGSPEELVLSQEDGTGVSVLKNSNADFTGTTMVYVNGLGQSWIPFHDIDGIHSQLGILPVMLHPAPASVAVIGLGSGDTAYSLGGREETTAITSIEIVKPQLETLQMLQARRPYGGLEGLLSDPRYRFVFTDGRSFLARQETTYDVIQADALRPNSAYAGNLYSYEYFMLIRSRLNPGGLTVTWAPTERVRTTFLQVFPHVIQVGSILVGSPDPILYDPAVLRTRAEHPFSQAHYARAGIDVMALLAPLLEPGDLSIFPDPVAGQNLNTDLQPRDEYNR
jgi:predicted membrane-bound spermidine synthase